MLLPSVAISIAINYLGKSLTPVPTTEVALITVFLPSSAIAIFLWWQSSKSVDS
jgi:hypothetical protein